MFFSIDINYHEDVTEVQEKNGPKCGKDRSLHPAEVSVPLC